MYPTLLLPLIGIISVVSGTTSEFPSLPCKDHRDCTSQNALDNMFDANGYGMEVAVCKWGQCESLLAGKKCFDLNDCGFFHSCSDGRCVLGGVGERCRLDSVHCAVGHSCDAATGRCVRGVEGVKCRDTDGCGFGHSCNLVYPLPWQRTKRVGVCRRGTLGTDHCRRDSQCEGNMLCIARPITYPGNTFKRYQCSKPADYGATRFPAGFAPCATDFECNKYAGTSPETELTCIQGRCQPLSLGQSCAFDFIASNRQCSIFTACVNGTCAYAKEGDSCWSESYGTNTQCAPGLQCTAPRDQGVGKKGKCVAGVVGSRCFDAEDCSSNLVCGTSGKCSQSAEGELCRSDFYCPSHLVCNKNTTTCHPPHTVPVEHRFPEVERSIACRTSVNCLSGGAQLSCKNGICLPKSLGWACKGDSSSSAGVACDGGLEVEGTLGKLCDSAYNCLFGLTCKNAHIYRGGRCEKSTLGSSCHFDHNCPPHLACSSNSQHCIRPQRGEGCRSHNHCPRGLRCIKTFNRHGKYGICA